MVLCNKKKRNFKLLFFYLYLYKRSIPFLHKINNKNKNNITIKMSIIYINIILLLSPKILFKTFSFGSRFDDFIIKYTNTKQKTTINIVIADIFIK